MAAAHYDVIFRYGELTQKDYDSLAIDFSGLENLTFDETGNPSPRQENSSISKKYGNLQIEFIYPKGSIYKFDGSPVSISDQYIGENKVYSLTIGDDESHTQILNSYQELLVYLQPYLYSDGPEISTFSMVTDAYGSDEASIRLSSGGMGFTQYGFPFACEIEFSYQGVPADGTETDLLSFDLQETCPPNQAAFFPGLLDSIGFMDKIDYFITTEGNPNAFPIIIDPHDAFVIFPGNIIGTDETNSYLFIIDSATRIHLTAHNNYIHLSTDWTTFNALPTGRFSFPHATLEMMRLPGELLYGKQDRIIDSSSVLKIVDGRKFRLTINSTTNDPNDNPIILPFYAKGLFEEIILNDKRLIKISEDE